MVPREPGLPPGPVSVALLLPLSGPSAALGRAMLDAAQLALFDVGVDKFVLLPKDTAGLPDGAARAAEAAIRDGASLILGPLFSGSVGAVVPLAEAAGIKVIAFSSDRNAARPGVYLMGFLPDQQVERVVGFARERGYGRFAALAPASHYGETVVRELRRVAQATGAELVDSVFYPADVRAASDVSDIIRVFADFDARRQRLLAQRRALEARDDEVSREALRRLEGLDTLGDLAYDAVLLPEGGLRLLTVAPLLPYYDAGRDKVRLLGTAQWETAALDQEPALVGGWYAAPPPEARRGFESRFAELFGHAPPRLATLAYDAVALAGALARLPDGPDFSAETLTNAGGFRGLDGLFRFAPDGTNERGLAVLEVTARGVVTVSPAPRSFAAF
ncbi:MAG: penicillin-binding protein activator [Alphaproteobacteria bacterium]